ncbi:sialate O-acetylesterase [soil metagenome]
MALGCVHPAATPAPSAARLDLYLLAGQSNMAGRGAVEGEDRVAVIGISMLDRNMTWVPAVDPVHFDKPSAGVGPGRAFAIAVHAKDSTHDIGLVPAAVGGSPIASWEPGALDAATKTHPYDDAIARARVAMRDGRFRAILWHQGEADATPEPSVLYAQRLHTLITRLRAELGDPALPFIIGQLGQFPRSSWNASKVRVDSAQRAIAATMPGVEFVSSDGLHHRGDSLHFDSPSARELGRRYAAAYLTMAHR